MYTRMEYNMYMYVFVFCAHTELFNGAIWLVFIFRGNPALKTGAGLNSMQKKTENGSICFSAVRGRRFPCLSLGLRLPTGGGWHPDAW